MISFSQQVFWPQVSLIQMLYYCTDQHLQIHNSALLFDKGLGPQILCSEVGGIVPGRLSKLIIMPFIFLPNGSFNPKYHLFDSVLLSRIVFINAEQDLFISWDFGPRRRSQFKNKKNSQDCMSMHYVSISKIQRQNMSSKVMTFFINIKMYYNVQRGA